MGLGIVYLIHEIRRWLLGEKDREGEEVSDKFVVKLKVVLKRGAEQRKDAAQKASVGRWMDGMA